jgi:peptide deformylase
MEYKPKLLPIKYLGEDILRKKAKRVEPEEIKTDKFQRLIEDMKYTMLEEDGAALAAPQVGVLKKLFVVNAPYYTNEDKILVMINPELKKLSNKLKKGFDGCVSIPGFLGFTRRPKKLRVDYLDGEGQEDAKIYTGIMARTIHHENDHLEGVLWLDRVDDMKDVYQASVFRKKFG